MRSASSAPRSASTAPRPRCESAPRRSRSLEQQRGEQLLRVTVDVGQRDGRPRVGRVGVREPKARRRALARFPALHEVPGPGAAAVGALDARDEARHDRLDRRQDHLAVAARLGQRVADQVQDQLLVGLAGGVDAHVGERGGRQQPAEQVERLAWTARARAASDSPSTRGYDESTHARTRGSSSGVGVEQRVHRGVVLGPELGVAVVAIAAAGHRRVVGDVAGGLLEVGAEARALEDLRQHVRDPLAGDVGAAELGDRSSP